jgi:hypothetical protein
MLSARFSRQTLVVVGSSSMRRSAMPTSRRSANDFAFTLSTRPSLSPSSGLAFSASRALSTSSAAATGASDNKSSQGTTGDEKTKKKNDDDGLPWGLFVGFGLVGSVAAWFYRSWKNNKKRDVVKAAKAAEMALAGEEVSNLNCRQPVTP